MSENNAPQIVAGLAVMTVVSFVFMASRFICKARYGKQTGWDDYILGISWVSLLDLKTLKFGDSTMV
jgi:hypothetical protein